MSKTEGCPPYQLQIEDVSLEIIDLYGRDPEATREVKSGQTVVVVRNCEIIAQIKAKLEEKAAKS